MANAPFNQGGFRDTEGADQDRGDEVLKAVLERLRGGPARSPRQLFYAWLLATLLSGIPSTVYALLTGGDPSEATRAAGAMLLPSENSFVRLFLAAALVHATISLFWAVVLWFALPHRHVIFWATAASMAIAVLDLAVIAPLFFPEVAALAFWPQFADHLMWGACCGLGLSLQRPARY